MYVRLAGLYANSNAFTHPSFPQPLVCVTYIYNEWYILEPHICSQRTFWGHWPSFKLVMEIYRREEPTGATYNTGNILGLDDKTSFCKMQNAYVHFSEYHSCFNPRGAVGTIGNIGVLKIEQDNQNSYRTSEYRFGKLRMSGVHIHYVLCAQIHR